MAINTKMMYEAIRGEVLLNRENERLVNDLFSIFEKNNDTFLFYDGDKSICAECLNKKEAFEKYEFDFQQTKKEYPFITCADDYCVFNTIIFLKTVMRKSLPEIENILKNRGILF